MIMEKFNILVGVRKLIDQYNGKNNVIPEKILKKYLSVQKLSSEEKNFLLNDLSELLLNDDYTVEISTIFTPVLLELLSRAAVLTKDDPNTKHEWLCICLSKLVWNFPEVARFAKQYFKEFHFFLRFEEASEPPNKRFKSDMMAAPVYKLLRAANLLLLYDTQSFKDLCDWTVLMPFLNDKEPRTRWYAYHCLGHIFHIKDIESIMRNRFTKEEFITCSVEEFDNQLWTNNQFRTLNIDNDPDLPALKPQKYDLSKSVVSVEGVLLSKIAHLEDCVKVDKFVYVPTLQKSLFRLAVAVSAGEPVLLQGPVGCGKTSLVEHLASLTGRKPFKDLLKVQLGDHMDAKMLLGTHCCTEVPGEFEWKSGILIQAMTEGHWLILEDIDCAPMDVISLLVPVLKSNTVVLPGHANPIRAAAGFQLFATQRLIRGLEGSYTEYNRNIKVIDSDFRKILMQPIQKEELKRIINIKWPRMEKISDKILEIYSLFSLDVNDDNTNVASYEPFNSYCQHGRLVSTRDLFKFCDRISEYFESQKKDKDILGSVFQNSIECFCDNIPDPKKRLEAAEAIGVKINLSASKVNAICQKKPLVEKSEKKVTIGRASVPRINIPLQVQMKKNPVFAYTKQSCVLLEKVAVAVCKREPVLLVGETGTGKTSVVQYLSHLTQHKLTVINMNQQSDAVDLIGGYKPSDLIATVGPMRDKFLELFFDQKVIKQESNVQFLHYIADCFYKRKYEYVIELIMVAQQKMVDALQTRKCDSEIFKQIGAWIKLGEQLKNLKRQVQKSKNTLIFKFIEGALVKAMKKGDWLLLDEINLAEAETLECLSGILEKHDNTLFLHEKGSKEPVKRHEDFRLFACMNPATDVGKKDLPVGIRNRFTEFFVDEIEDKNDLSILVQEYLRALTLNPTIVENIVNFYLRMKNIASEKLSDGAGHRPHYSLRTLCRALKYASRNPCHNVPRSLYEAFCLSFLSQLDNESHSFVSKYIGRELLGKNELSVLKQSIPEPSSGKHHPIAGYWIRSGKLEAHASSNYIFTNTVEKNLRDLARIVSASQYPVLIQGETSVGKTSLIQWLAQATGNVCVRINNHEHTDIQEYIGTYSADDNGKLTFKEGILAEAMRNGYWIILDELNLAPTEVMEALNRVLDDNRELFIPETQTLIKAHPGFMIFATQNPPGLYGGRKLLSRAFRNRFIELHFNEIPPCELVEILEKRCKLPLSYSTRLVAVMRELQMRRRESGVFFGKQGFITLRDLFRWGERYEKTPEPQDEKIDWMQYLADEGYLLLAGRVRHPLEEQVILETIKKELKREVNPDLLFNLSEKSSFATRDILGKVLSTPVSDDFKNVVWTSSMRRLAVLVGKAIQYNEPVLLIGTTGSGKTTICQMFADIFGKTLNSVNCHMHSESTDFLGGLRPVRDSKQREQRLFEWVDGPLIQAMTSGNFFLCDEISLADDSVLERLNSVLEPEQKILVPERSFDNFDNFEINAQSGFHFFATMNPGGDYGKKELSPALRNRFTEIWCPNSMSNSADIIDIVEHNINKKLKFHKYAREGESGFGIAIAKFLHFYSGTDIGKRVTLSIRDVLTWVEFINLFQRQRDSLSSYEAYIHGAFLAFLDGIGSGSCISSEKYMLDVKRYCFEFLKGQVRNHSLNFIELMMPELNKEQFENIGVSYTTCKKKLALGPFAIACVETSVDEEEESPDTQYILEATTPKANILKIFRAMQLPKPILLEGSPGVGKTSLISTLAKLTGHGLVRINLSEQTDISDLFGADLPVHGGEKGEFAWRDGPLIQALKNGDWILLDELNLASQSVLEGLNACLDHRNEIYLPELGMTFNIDKYISRIFCCQNPQRQGGSRKGLPQSFLNRFTQVYMRPMEADDMEFITTSVFYEIPPRLVQAMVQFNNELSNAVNVMKEWGHQGSPWEFNLRDIFRLCHVMIANQRADSFNLGEYVKLIYMDRMRTTEDVVKTSALYRKIAKQCGLKSHNMVQNRTLKLNVFENYVQLGNAFLSRKGVCHNDSNMTCISPMQLRYLESLMKCIEMNWMAILVGPSGCGKSTIVRALAELCGQQLHVLSVNSEMDTIELLGGFEQADINRKIEFIAQDIEPFLERAIAVCLTRENCHADFKLQDLLEKHHCIRKHIYSKSSLQENDCLRKLDSLKGLIKTLESLKMEHSRSFLKARRKVVEKLIRQLESRESFNGGTFEWVDSMLIDAATKGHWLLIDDANFCSPSVLDRLNGLLEPDGVLAMNEQGIVDKELRTIVPHEDFRIILTVNPKYGEISRAMRNRGVEIYIEPLPCHKMIRQPAPFDASMFAHCKGLVHNKLLLSFFQLFDKFGSCPVIDYPSMTDFVSAVTLCVQMIQKHGIAQQAFEDSCSAVFADAILNASAREEVLKLIKEESQSVVDIKPDFTPPITELLPTSFDYRQSTFLSALKKHSCLYIMFYKEYVGKLLECPLFPELQNLMNKGRFDEKKDELYVCPPPNSFFAYVQEIRKFTAVMRVTFESCPINCVEYLLFLIQHWLQGILPSLKEADKDLVKHFYLSIMKYRDVIEKVFNGPLMKNLNDTSTDIFKDIEGLSYMEVPFDLRWNPGLYHRVLQQPDVSDNVNENVSRANKCHLLLQYRTSTFVNELTSGIPNCESLAGFARTPNVKRQIPDSKALPVIMILPKFIEAFTASIFTFIEDESIHCSDEYYFKLFETLSTYNFFQHIYHMHAEKGIELTLRVLGFYFTWLLKKIKILYQKISMPVNLSKYAEELELLFSYNLPTLKFRHRCMKILGLPPAFRDREAFDAYKRIDELSQYLDMVKRLKDPQCAINDWKVIFTNQKNWLPNFLLGAFESLYDKDKRMDSNALRIIQIIKTQMTDSGVIKTEDDDIMEVCQNPAQQPKMSDEDLVLEIQTLPLWDYLFVTFEAEMISAALLFIDQKVNSKCVPIVDNNLSLMLQTWGTDILVFNPVHLVHIINLHRNRAKESIAPTLLYFFKHTRHGFSSNGLSALNLKIEGKNICKDDSANRFWNNYSWSKQQPVFSHIFSTICGKPADTDLICQFPLGLYGDRMKQLKKTHYLVWKHFDRLTDSKKTFKHHSASIVISWFNNLLTAFAVLGKLNISESSKMEILNLFKELKIASLVETKEGGDNILLLAFDSVFELKAKLIEDDQDECIQWLTAKAYAYVGLFSLMILMPKDSYDPAMKASNKTGYYREIRDNLFKEYDMRNWLEEKTTGQSLGKRWFHDHSNMEGLKEWYEHYRRKIEHPHSEIQRNLIEQYSKKAELTCRKIHFRNNDEQMFYSLKGDIVHFMNTLLNPEAIVDVVSKLEHAQYIEEESDFDYVTAIERAKNLSINLQSVVDHMLNKYSLYPDLLVPFLVGVEQVIFGLSMSCHTITVKENMIGRRRSQKITNLNGFLERFSHFSTENWKSSLDMASLVLKKSTISDMNSILTLLNEHAPLKGRLLYKFMKSAVLDLINEIKMQSEHPEDKLLQIKELLLSAFNYFYKTWEVQDEIRKKKKAEEEKLFKTVHHEGELSDEEKMDKALKEMFPSYEEDYSGIRNQEDCNDTESNPPLQKADDDKADDSLMFSDADMFEICQLHATAVALLTYPYIKQDGNLFIIRNKDLDLKTPFLLRHEVISSIVTTFGSQLDSFFEKNLLKEQMLLSQELQEVKNHDKDEYYDIYHDPNPEKVVSLYGILKELVARVNVLLKEFPENPNLVQILTVTQRVLSFPVSDPLMKFVIGLEIILEATQHWEQNAHSKVSLKFNIEEITKRIIEFRSMELDVWKQGLQNVMKKQYIKSSKWWFFMFPLFYTDNTYAENEKALIMRGLQQCLEDSPIGEYPAKLNILRTFLEEFHLHSSSKSSKSYADILFNVYTYYEQFLPAIENEIMQIRKPIEKEIKDFVKIARWNDLNFYSVKASVDKSHKFVLKHVKAFEDGIQKPAKTVFSLPSKNNSESGENTWTLEIKEKDFIYDVPKVKSEYFRERGEAFFQKFPKYQKKVKKLCKQIADTCPITGYINTLNDFCGNIIEALESVTLDGQKSVCTRSREKKQTLLKIQNKKQMLSTLFKNLKAIGLSYRQGMLKYGEDRATQLMSLPAFDISKMKMLKSDSAFKELLSKSFCDTNHYFYKSMAQYAQLHKFMEQPSKDLTLDVIHRIQGYGSHLLTLISSQRIATAQTIKDVDRFGSFLSVLSTIYEKQDFTYEKNLTIIPPQKYFKECNLEINNLLVIIALAASQFESLLDCAPEEDFLKGDVGLHFPSFDEGRLSGVFKGDRAWSSIKHALTVFNCDIQKLSSQLSEWKLSETIVSWDHLRTFSSVYQSLQKSMESLLVEITKHCHIDSPLIQSLCKLKERICDKGERSRMEEDLILDSQMHIDPPNENEQSCILAKLCQKLAVQLTLAIQETVVLFSSTEEVESENVVPDNLFTIKISGSLSKVKECLRFSKVSKIVRKLKGHFSHFQNSTEDLLSNDKSFRLLVNLAPLLNQYYQIVKVYLALSLGMHRTSCKFLTILLEIFTILATKGFCIPPELQEEAAKAGATQFEDIESGGLGEGEGSKDVSDRIESEDQLEDAMKEGEEKKDDESKDKDLKDEEQGIEMSDDFEGKLHGGDGNEENSDEENENDESTDLDKHMGDVENDEAEKLDDKVWGSDSEEEDESEKREDDGSGGVAENMASELVAKDNKLKDEDDENGSEKENNQPQEIPADQLEEEYEGEKPDPMINAPPTKEPEIEELPEDMEITDEVGEDGEGNDFEEMKEPEENLDESKDEDDEYMETEDLPDYDDDDENNKAQEDAEGEAEENGKTADQEDTEQPADDAEKNESALPTQTPTSEVQAIPSEMKQSSSDPVKTEEIMDYDTGAQSSEEQHKEGISDATDMPSADPGHEGKKSSAKSKEAEEAKQNQKLKAPGENRSVDESADEQNAKKRQVMEKKANEKTMDKPDEDCQNAEMYEHVSKEEKSKTQAIDIATEKQAEIRTAQNQSAVDDDEEEIIELSSSDDEDVPCNKADAETMKSSQSQKPGSKGNEEGEIADLPDGDIVQTQTVNRSHESSLHTQNELWKSMSSRSHVPQRLKHMGNINMAAQSTSSRISEEKWRTLERSNLSQELCEQLRLVLEPTKMSKFKGDYRTGKRLNMRKIIPYIASQFRKDKIWLRRTKPSKRQYQIMLAMDDSSSMDYNNAKQLAFESLAVLGQSLTLLEAGELSVVSFGEKVELLHGFQDQFSASSGATILEKISFAQKETRMVQLLDYATNVMVQARNNSQSSIISKETAQLLIIISDGRNIFREGESKVKAAVKNARDNNIFMVFLVLDNMENKKSILDGKYSVVENNEIKTIPYMDKFPFPFYIILREITALPQVLGEALRQWFELVTSVDR